MYQGQQGLRLQRDTCSGRRNATSEAQGCRTGLQVRVHRMLSTTRRPGDWSKHCGEKGLTRKMFNAGKASRCLASHRTATITKSVLCARPIPACASILCACSRVALHAQRPSLWKILSCGSKPTALTLAAAGLPQFVKQYACSRQSQQIARQQQHAPRVHCLKTRGRLRGSREVVVKFLHKPTQRSACSCSSVQVPCLACWGTKRRYQENIATTIATPARFAA